MIGQTISHYKITEKLGEGGMGVVYKAEDTKLGRTVALKFLAAHLLNDAEAKERFLREARAAASLNHANICTVHEIDEADGKTFIAMAFVEGESLEEKIARGPLPIQDTLDAAQQIARGLQAAHEKGIIHRDIKPANILLDANGHATIMDFGLARLTEASRLTKADTTMGTVAYMSPEQAQGSEVDHRCDIWALGCVLYEMVCGQRPFRGQYDQALFYEIVNQEPEPLTGMRAGVPMEMEFVVGKCLEKDADRRYQQANEIAVDLQNLQDKRRSGRSTILRTTNRAAGSFTTTATSEAGNPARAWLWPAVAALFAIVAIAFALAFIALRTSPRPSTTRLSISLPPGQEVTSCPAISYDGQIIAYTAQVGTDEPQLYLRHLDSFEARPVAGSSGAMQPFFSPDAKWVAFFAQGQLQKVEVAGGTPIRLAEAAFPFGGTWNQDDNIIYAASLGSGLLRIPASGGTPEALTSPDGAAQGYAHVFPQALPGGRRVLFTIWGQTQGAAVLPLDSGQWEMVLPSTTSAAIFEGTAGSKGRLLVTDQAAGIRAAPFDAAHPERISADTSVLADVYYTVGQNQGWLAVSRTGATVYAPGNPAKSSLVWVDQGGKAESLGVDQGAYQQVTLSPDGTKAAVKQADEIWIHDLQRGTRSRLTPANTSSSSNSPRWSSDGERMIFASNRGGDWDIYSQPADGSGPAEALLSRPYDQIPTAVLADGTVLYQELNPQTGHDLWTLSPSDLSEEGMISPFRITPFNEELAEVSASPEGGPRWAVYSSDESGRSEIYVQLYPSGANRTPVSTGGGFSPRWSRDGRELFYVTGDAITAVTIRPDGSFGAPRTLFARANFFFSTIEPSPSYDTSPDGKRFLMIRRDPGSVPRQLNVILNWAEER